MTADPGLEERITGCLVGAAIGAELGFARCVEPERFAATGPEGIFEVELTATQSYRPQPHWTVLRSADALVHLGVRAYLASDGRATPEGFGELLRRDEGVAFPAWRWDGLHTVQEVLKEGMHPRLSGLGTCPCGLICAAMPAVGVYHFAHPDYAYLDGVELASVAQGRLGADWAGLCAAAIAAAFEKGATGEGVVDAVMKIAFENCRELFYELDWVLRRTNGLSEEAFLEQWCRDGGAPQLGRDNYWVAYNPLRFVLGLLSRYAGEPEKLLALLVVPPPFLYVPTISAVIGGAVAGAIHGPGGFSKAWRGWAEPIAQ
ncbi:hypothetical protein LCGC14_2398270, partial [marine sediment metagenome]